MIEAVAKTKSVAPLEIEDRLNEIVDPDAMSTLFADRANGQSRVGGQLSFVLSGCWVQIDGDLDVEVTEVRQDTDTVE